MASINFSKEDTAEVAHAKMLTIPREQWPAVIATMPKSLKISLTEMLRQTVQKRVSGTTVKTEPGAASSSTPHPEFQNLPKANSSHNDSEVSSSSGAQPSVPPCWGLPSNTARSMRETVFGEVLPAGIHERGLKYMAVVGRHRGPLRSTIKHAVDDRAYIQEGILQGVPDFVTGELEVGKDQKQPVVSRRVSKTSSRVDHGKRGGNRLNTKRRKKRNSRIHRTVFLTNLPFAVTEEELRNLLNLQIGPVREVRLAKDQVTGKSCGFAHATFKKVWGAQECVRRHDGLLLKGRFLSVQPCSSSQKACSTNKERWRASPWAKALVDMTTKQALEVPKMFMVKRAMEKKAHRKLEVTNFGFRNFWLALDALGLSVERTITNTWRVGWPAQPLARPTVDYADLH